MYSDRAPSRSRIRLPLPIPPMPLFLAALCIPTLVYAFEGSGLDSFVLRRRSNPPPEGFYDPRDRGGSFVTKMNNTTPEGLGEPLNAIISGNSDPAVLVDHMEDGGLQNYFISIGFAGECLGQHSGAAQQADLGDGRGYVNETAVIRWHYGDPALGTCRETIEGGNHFRYWTQDGNDANSGAVFMAVSYEKPLEEFHDIVDNGYNLGRDQLVGNATNSVVPTGQVTNTSSYVGTTEYNGYTYQTSVEYFGGLVQNSSEGINHFQGFTTNAVDGLVAVLTVSITQAPMQATSSSALRSFSLPPSISACLLPPLLVYLLLTLFRPSSPLSSSLLS